MSYNYYIDGRPCSRAAFLELITKGNEDLVPRWNGKIVTKEELVRNVKIATFFRVNVEVTTPKPKK